MDNNFLKASELCKNCGLCCSGALFGNAPLLEGEEEKAALIMSARDMVDKVTGWLEDTASLKSETMLELVDSIRDELGSDISGQYASTVKPALEELYTTLETARTTLAQAVAILTGEEGPAGPAGAPEMGMPGEEEFPSGDEFAAAEANTLATLPAS